MQTTPNPTQRFSDRVDNYVKYRPTYPHQLVEFMKGELGLTPNHAVADIGSGTGLSTEPFLKNGNVVYAVEPNDNMRLAAEAILQKYPNLRSQKGTSEATGLADRSIDIVIAAQAFHWFEPSATRAEFKRILKPGGCVALIWNDRKIAGSDFAVAYEALINKYGTDYKQVNHKNIDDKKIENFLGSFKVHHFHNEQKFNFEGILGRLTSSSYSPNIGQPRYEEMVLELKSLFERYNQNGIVTVEYDTKIYYSRLPEGKVEPQLIALTEVSEEHIPLLSKYWYHSPPGFIDGIGVDSARLPEESEFAKRLQEACATNKNLPSSKAKALVILYDGKPVGLHTVNPVTEGDSAIFHAHIFSPEWRNRGLARFTYVMAAKIFIERFNLQRILYKTPQQNTGSIKVKQNLGIRYIGEEVLDFGIVRAGTVGKVFELTQPESEALIEKTGFKLHFTNGRWSFIGR